MKIDRKALVSRHNPEFDRYNPYSPLSIGNGEIVFSADITGFQTFPTVPGDAVPLCTMSQWGFHSYPGMENRDAGYSSLRLKEFVAGDRLVGYMSESEGQEKLFSDLRINPHRANLMRLGFVEPEAGCFSDENRGTVSGLDLKYCGGIRQKLDLWEGILSSGLTYKTGRISSLACCHPSRDAFAYRIRSDLLAEGRLALVLEFPYPSHQKDGSDWGNPRGHQSRLSTADENGVYTVSRRIDDFSFRLIIHIDEDGILEQIDAHRFLLLTEADVLSFSVEFRRPDSAAVGTDSLNPVSVEECLSSASAYWNGFWNNGAAVELKDSRDPRALELERRIVLSRYLTAIQCSGSLPPQETGLTCNSWYGKFHLEMHLWHATFFPLWGNPEMLERSLGYYERIYAKAEHRAAEQGYTGLRWPKMTDPEGYDSPSVIGPFLCWQQPHFIFMAELLYRTGKGDDPAEKYGKLVFESAEFMAEYPVYNMETDTYDLGPPLIPAQENHLPEETKNPVFELEYWKLGLKIASEWQARAGKEIPEKWTRVMVKLAKPPLDPESGGYAAHQNCSDTYGVFGVDHPSFLAAYSFFSGIDVDPEVMSASLDLVLKKWNMGSLWGWDFPMMAMCAARLGRFDEAFNLLLMDADKNAYLANGHNAQLPKPDLPLYLPGNGALLLAVAMIAGRLAGGENNEAYVSGNQNWVVRSEGFSPLPF